MNMNGFEIERKFLIELPTPEVLARCSDVSDITQTYLVPLTNGTSDRVRRRGREGEWTYTHTVKLRLTDAKRVENESEITEEEYNELLRRADTKRNVIRKTRYCLDYLEQTFEIDVYPFWNDRAVMELELENEAQEIIFPPDIVVVRELTSDRRYTNASLALNIPDEPLYI